MESSLPKNSMLAWPGDRLKINPSDIINYSLQFETGNVSRGSPAIYGGGRLAQRHEIEGNLLLKRETNEMEFGIFSDRAEN